MDADIDNYLSKFKDDDDVSLENVNSTHIKKKKQGIRPSNKFFTDYSLEGEEEIVFEQ